MEDEKDLKKNRALNNISPKALSMDNIQRAPTDCVSGILLHPAQISRAGNMVSQDNKPPSILSCLTEFSLEYSLDCTGCYDMPIQYIILPSFKPHISIGNSKKIWKCNTDIPTICSPCNLDPYVLNFFTQDENIPAWFLKIRLKVYGTSWFSSNDKAEVCVYDENQELNIGYIVKKEGYCQYLYELYNQQDEMQYEIVSECSYGGVVCHCPCGKCKKLKLRINDAKNKNSVGEIIKVNISFYV